MEEVTFENVFAGYSLALSQGPDTTLRFIFDNRRLIRDAVGFYGFKQFTLNYRIYFDNRRNKDKLLHDLEKYVLQKTTRHKSNLAIGHNVLTKLAVAEELEHRVVDFMFDRMKDTYLAKFKQLENSRVYVLKRHLVVSHVNDYVLKKPHIK
jgi:hypothetical protein